MSILGYNNSIHKLGHCSLSSMFDVMVMFYPAVGWVIPLEWSFDCVLGPGHHWFYICLFLPIWLLQYNGGGLSANWGQSLELFHMGLLNSGPGHCLPGRAFSSHPNSFVHLLVSKGNDVFFFYMSLAMYDCHLFGLLYSNQKLFEFILVFNLFSFCCPMAMFLYSIPWTWTIAKASWESV